MNQSTTKPQEKQLTALHFVAERGLNDCVSALLSIGGANVDAASSDGRTPLTLAAIGGHADVTDTLLSFRANPSFQDRSLQTPRR